MKYTDHVFRMILHSLLLRRKTSSPVGSRPPPSFPFLRLPPEIRIIIYDHLFGPATTTIFWNALVPAVKDALIRRHEPNLSIIATCRLIHHEALPIFYKHARVIMHLGLQQQDEQLAIDNFASRLGGQDNTRFITKLSLKRGNHQCMTDDFEDGAAGMLQSIANWSRPCPALQELRLVYQWLENIVRTYLSQDRTFAPILPPTTKNSISSGQVSLLMELKVLIEAKSVEVYDPHMMAYMAADMGGGLCRLMADGDDLVTVPYVEASREDFR
ncbi:MAG: hypothetical protein Q9168_007577 [Polycauliona sp. 1 TL-2023]